MLQISKNLNAVMNLQPACTHPNNTRTTSGRTYVAATNVLDCGNAVAPAAEEASHIEPRLHVGQVDGIAGSCRLHSCDVGVSQLRRCLGQEPAGNQGCLCEDAA